MGLYQTKVEQGFLEGTDQGDYAVYKGVPYAKPPVGDLRFCPPQKAESWTGVRKAVEFPSIAWQRPLAEGSFYEKEFYRGDDSLRNRSEDCLYLNIWTPAKKKEDGLPVLFWIHGGAFRQGFGHETEFDGKAYCERGVILVTIQYRLGVFGFLAHPWLEGGGGNLALQDQIMALRWVYDNIPNFGGDAHKITVAGQSAGGVSVHALLCSPQTKDMIHQAIMQSGGGYGQLERRCRSKDEVMLIGKEFLKKCSIHSPEELQRIKAEDLLMLADNYGLSCHLIVSADGDEEGLMPEAWLYRENTRGIACLMGSNKNDIRVTEEMLRNGVPSDLYTGNAEFAGHFGKNGNCYLYFFQHQLPGDDAGAFHSAELWYMFGTLHRSWRPFTEEDYKISEKMLDAWCRFIKTGQPGRTEEEWSAYREKNPYVHVIGKA